VDGVLVEKVMGIIESSLACDLIKVLGNFLDEHPLGFLAGPDGAVRLMPGLVRIPDVSFISWQQLGSRKRPTRPIPHLAPVLAIEVLSKGNTGAEMNRKVRDYFLSGVRQVWFVNPRRRTVQVFTAPDESVVHTEDEVLDGGDVLPGLALPLRHIFVGVPRRSGRSTRRGNGGRPRNPREK
jgi:Uma2 family endonuclease